MVESDRVEFKLEAGVSFAKEIVGFANAEGGSIYVGVSDDGAPIGVEDSDATQLKIISMVRDAVVPDATGLVRVRALSQSECQALFGAPAPCGLVVVVEVQRGGSSPYYLAGKGPTPSGVFVRQGPSTAPASRDAILAMIQRAAGFSFEQELSLEQELSFSVAKSEFAKRGLKLGTSQMRTLRLLNEDGLYSNLALLLSDECPFVLQAATFQGVTVTTMRDRRFFEGSVLAQVRQLTEYLALRNDTSGVITLKGREETQSYPEEALREALLNMVMHRDYSSGAINKVSVFDDRIEFHTAGGLAHGIRKEEVTSGTSVCRNPRLADVLFRLKLVEAYGTGLLRIFAAYAGQPVEPVVEVSENVFRLTLPNLNYVREHGASVWVGKAVAGEATPGFSRLGRPHPARTGEVRHMILNIVGSNGAITRLEVEQILGVSRSSAGRILEGMVSDGDLKKNGRGRATSYTAA